MAVGWAASPPRQDINALNGAIADLQQFSHRAQSGNNQQNVEHASTVVNNLKQRLLATTKEFKEVSYSSVPLQTVP
jgi:syntaxin 5